MNKNQGFIYAFLANTVFVLIIPYLLKMISLDTSYQAMYMSLGVAIYFLVTGRYFATITNKSYILVAISLPFSIALMYLLFNTINEQHIQYIALHVIFSFLGVRLGNTKKRLEKLREEMKKSVDKE